MAKKSTIGPVKIFVSKPPDMAYFVPNGTVPNLAHTKMAFFYAKIALSSTGRSR
jgi:hypothetical protein